MEALQKFIYTFINPNQEEWSLFKGYIKEEVFPKGKKVIKSGAISSRIYFVNKGFLKYLVASESKEKAIHIAVENDLVADFFSFYSGYPAISSVETITECSLFYIEKKDLEILYKEYKIWEKFGRLVAEFAVLDQMMEKLNFQTKSPEQRYLELIEKKPSIIQEVNLGIIAECLGITQETLSRIRARI
jgi:CRP-like cAMP-binding protein